MNKKLIASLGMLTILSSVFLGALVSQAQNDGFPDVPESHTNVQAINYLKTKTVLQGDDETGTFRPASSLNRAEFAAIIARLAGMSPDKDKYRNCFPDVKEEWFAPAVCWAKEQGYVKGFEAGELKGMYGPSKTLINAEAIVILSRMAGWDVKEGKEWYEGAMTYAKEKGILDGSFDVEITRALMAEAVFRSAVSADAGNTKYDQDAGDEFVKEEKEVLLGVAPKEEPKTEEPTEEPKEEVKKDPIDVNVATVEYKATEAKEDSTDVAVVKFSVMNTSKEHPVEMTGLKVTANEKTNMDYVVAMSLKDKDGKVVAGPVMKKGNADWMKGMILFGDFKVEVEKEATAEFTVSADLDLESSGVVQFMISEKGDITLTEPAVNVGEYPIVGMSYELEVLNKIGNNTEEFPVCANFDPELNLPYASNTTGSKSKVPAEAGTTVTPTTGGHNINPIDQGNRGICLAAATYSSLRWFEDNNATDRDLVENGTNGLEDLVSSLYGAKIDTADKQLAELERKLEAEHPECVEVEYDTQAGLNVACTELKEYKDKGCDIPLLFFCTKVDANGDPVVGEEAERWGHAVDLTDVIVDENDDDKCSITYANSWKDSANPRPDVDGLGSGRYEQADYDDDSEDFKLKAPWGAGYKCELYAAAYICIDKNKCEKK